MSAVLNFRSSLTNDAWMRLAACREVAPEVFFPGQNGDTRTPKAICAGCPVRAACLEYALTNYENDGIWGRTTGAERRRIRRERRAS